MCFANPFKWGRGWVTISTDKYAWEYLSIPNTHSMYISRPIPRVLWRPPMNEFGIFPHTDLNVNGVNREKFRCITFQLNWTISEKNTLVWVDIVHFNYAVSSPVLIHWPLRNVTVILGIFFLKPLIVAWATAVKLLSDECQRTTVRRIPYWCSWWLGTVSQQAIT